MTTTEQTTGWQLDETGARGYEANLVPAAMDPWAADLVDAAGLRPGDRVLDLGCGTGIVTRHAARQVGPTGSIAAVDSNPAMLAVARELTADLEAPATLHRTGADDLPFAEGEFDAVLCQQAIQFFPDPGAALGEVRRVTMPGGRLGIGTCRSLERQLGYLVLADVVERHLGRDAAQVIASPYALGDTDRLRALVVEAGFGDVSSRYVLTPFRFPSPTAFLAAETASSPLGDLTTSLDPDVLGGLVEELTARMRPHTDDLGVLFPFETVVVTATRP